MSPSISQVIKKIKDRYKIVEADIAVLSWGGNEWHFYEPGEEEDQPDDKDVIKSLDDLEVIKRLKNFEKTGANGPWMVTADEVPDPTDVPLELKVNGETRQKTNTAYLIYNVVRLIEFATSFYTLYPGDVIYTGTCSGVGPVKPGDVINLESPLIMAGSSS